MDKAPPIGGIVPGEAPKSPGIRPAPPEPGPVAPPGQKPVLPDPEGQPRQPDVPGRGRDPLDPDSLAPGDPGPGRVPPASPL